MTFTNHFMQIFLEVRGVFLDLSKAFDKVWHDGLLYKLRRIEICGEYLGLIDRFQRVLLNPRFSFSTIIILSLY